MVLILLKIAALVICVWYFLCVLRIVGRFWYNQAVLARMDKADRKKYLVPRVGDQGRQCYLHQIRQLLH